MEHHRWKYTKPKHLNTIVNTSAIKLNTKSKMNAMWIKIQEKNDHFK